MIEDGTTTEINDCYTKSNHVYINDNVVEDYIDHEWDLAENADEKPIYYFAEMYNGGRRIKKYKPSVAKLISKRTTLKMVPVQEELQ